MLLLLLASQIRSLTEHESESNQVHNQKEVEHHCCWPFSVMLAHFDHSLQLDKKLWGEKNELKLFVIGPWIGLSSPIPSPAFVAQYLTNTQCKPHISTSGVHSYIQILLSVTVKTMS